MQENENNLQELKIFGELIYEVPTFGHWVNCFPKNNPPQTERGEIRIWLDKEGNALTNGKDFHVARDKGLFPVRIYRVKRSSH